jgi:hypothetical protein
MINNPTTFISYAWESDVLKKWVKDLATQLRNNGIDAKLDQWEVLPGDQMPHFMEKSVRDNDFVLIICTPKYKIKSEERIGGVGYEGDIMTSEVLQGSNHRKFIPILKSGTKETSMPTWLKGKYFVDLSSDQHFANNFEDLLTTLLNAREKAPPLGIIQPKFIKGEPTKEPVIIENDTEIKIKGILIDEVTHPLNDGTRGSALYKIPFELNKRPSYEWIELFVNAWNRPPSFTQMHRPGIASVYGNKIVLDGTTIEEIEKYHKATLKLSVGLANKTLKELKERQKLIAEMEKQKIEEHKNKVGNISNRINFDD